MKLVHALWLILLPCSSGCVSILESEFEPVFTEALWERPEPLATVTVREVPGALPSELCRAARTGDGVWHVEARWTDGLVRHSTWDAANPALRSNPALEMARWASPGWERAGPLPLQLSALDWPAAALQVPVLAAPGAELPAEPAAGANPARELFAQLEPADAPGTIARLSPSGERLEVWSDGGWVELAAFQRLPRRVEELPGPVAPLPRRNLLDRAVRAILTPVTATLDAAYLSVLGASKLVIGVSLAPVLVFFLCSGALC